jgi:hypothetical protein
MHGMNITWECFNSGSDPDSDPLRHRYSVAPPACSSLPAGHYSAEVLNHGRGNDRTQAGLSNVDLLHCNQGTIFLLHTALVVSSDERSAVTAAESAGGRYVTYGR